MASFRSSGVPNLLPLCCGSRASLYNHHSLTFCERSYFPTAVCSLLSLSLTLSLPPPSLLHTLSFGCSPSCYLHLFREKSKRVKKMIMFLRRKQLLSDWSAGPKEASATAMAADIKIGLALPCCCRKRKKRRAGERETTSFSKQEGGEAVSISCCAAEASQDVTRSIRTLAGCQHRRRLILTLSRRPQDYNTHADSSQHLYRIQFNTECCE